MKFEGGPYRKGPTPEQQKEIEAREKALEILKSERWIDVDKLNKKEFYLRKMCSY